MPIARDDYPEYFPEKLWQWLPGIYRELDATEGSGALRAFVTALGKQAAFLKRNQDRVWNDGYIELASDWAVPYLADVVATRLVSALDLRARRVDVAKTIYYRRRKGTLLVLEQLISDMTGWDGKVVEEFRRLARAHHGLDGPPRRGRLTGTPEGGFIDVRSVRGALLAGDPFDECHYTPDARRPRGLSGRRGIPKLSFHEFRMHPVLFTGVVPRRVQDFVGPVDGFTFDPSGRDIALFCTDQSHPSGLRAADATGDWSTWRTAEEWQLPRPLTCRLTGEAIFEIGAVQIGWVRTTPLIATQPQRDAAAADLRKIAGERIVGRRPFQRLLAALPSAPVLTLAGVLAELFMRALVADCGSAALLPNGADTASWPGPIVPNESSFDQPALAVRFAGGDPVARSATRSARLDAWTTPVLPGVILFVEPERGRFVFNHDPQGFRAVRVDYHAGMFAPIGAGAFAREIDHGAPATIWVNGTFGTGTPANGAAEIQDSGNYLTPPDQLAAIDCTVRAAEDERPYVILDGVDWRFGAVAPNARLRLDGLWVGALQPRVVRLQGNFERVRLRYTTLDPGGFDALGNVIPPVALVVAGFVETLVITRCFLSSIRLAAGGSIERLLVRDSVVDARDLGTVAIDAPTANVRMARTTLIAPAIDDLALRCERLDATDTLIAGVAAVVNTQQGCFRFSARGPGSTVPHPYESHVVTEMARLFASRRFGDWRYALLSPAAPPEIARGAENTSEIGAFCSAIAPIKQDSLRQKVDEYMPFGRIANYIIQS
jgi:hypothetical protein